VPQPNLRICAIFLEDLLGFVPQPNLRICAIFLEDLLGFVPQPNLRIILILARVFLEQETEFLG